MVCRSIREDMTLTSEIVPGADALFASLCEADF